MNTKCLTMLILANLILSSTALATQPTGRLFSTPKERANLDYLRQTSKPPSQEQLLDEEELTAAPVMPNSISMQGYVKRSDGKKGTIWINNMPMQENSDSGEVRVGKLPRDGNQVKINIPASGRSVNLKAGQVYVPETDAILEDRARATEMPEPEVQDAGTIGANPSDQP